MHLPHASMHLCQFGKWNPHPNWNPAATEPPFYNNTGKRDLIRLRAYLLKRLGGELPKNWKNKQFYEDLEGNLMVDE